MRQAPSFANRRVWPIALIVVSMGLLLFPALARAQTSFAYIAETEKPTRKKGDVIAGALKWECVESRCTIIGPWSKLGVGSCQALARVVGRIKSFGRTGAALDAAQLSLCNAAPSGGVVISPLPPAQLRYGGCDDCDGDGHESPTAPLLTRPSADGTETIVISQPGDDCDDADPTRFPGNPEVCDADGHDEDCNPATVGSQDEDGDGHIDLNCRNGSGAAAIAGDDCDDTSGGVHPGVPEVCNGLDDDCDGKTDADDEDSLAIWVWEDRDRDGFGRSNSEVGHICQIGDFRGFSTNDYDCDDSNPRRHPGVGCP